MSRVATDVGLPDSEVSQLQQLLENPQQYLGDTSATAALYSGEDASNKNFYKYLNTKENLTVVPKKAFSTSSSSLSNNILYSQFYNELVEEYEGAKYNNPEFETYIIESYLRRKEK